MLHRRLRPGPRLVASGWMPLIVLLTASVCPADELLVIGGQVFRTETGRFEANPGLLIRDGRFVDAATPADSGPRLMLDADHFILPGLIDLHAHYNVRLLRRRREEFKVMPVVYLANGVTVTFSAGEFDPDGMLSLRKEIEAGKQIGPRLINSGPYFGRARPGWNRNMTAEQIQEEVDLWAGRGVGGFKAKAIGPEHLRVLIARAHSHGLTVTGHLDSGYRGSVNPRDAIEMGIDRIEHFLGGDGMPESRSAYASLAGITTDMPEFQRIVQLYVKKQTVFDCTITAYGYFGDRGEEYDYWIDERAFFTPWVQQRVADREHRVMTQFEEIYRAKLKTIAAYHQAGGIITLGTDHFSNGEFLPGFGAHRELDALVRAGIPPADALRIGTINGARALKIDHDYGSIEAGKVADLMIVRGNPLKNIRNTRNVEHVIRAGTLHDPAKLLDDVRGQLGPRDESEANAW